MSIFKPFIFCLGLLFTCSTLSAQTIAESRSVQLYTEVSASKDAIILHWDKTTGSDEFIIYKKNVTTNSPYAELTTIGASSELKYTDTDITQGHEYEYTIQKKTTLPDPFDHLDFIEGVGITRVAVEKDAVHHRDRLLLLVAEYLKSELSTEIEILRNDLINDGWDVTVLEIGENEGVEDIKASISTENQASAISGIYILGNVGVPYSGTYCEDPRYVYPPDGHTVDAPPSHCGAWPSDVYYGVFDGTWTDDVADTSAAREANKNRPDDGKYDNNSIPGTVTVGIGRVDFSNLPKFPKSEIELTRQYLDKVHAYKTGTVSLTQQGVVEDNFGGLAEGFSSSALSDFSAILGTDAIVKADIFSSARSADYLFAYGCGAGSYTRCNGVGHTDSFISNNGAAFNFLFGSYFGDWDTRDNFLRASLASEKLGFTAAWSGRPKWGLFPLGLGASFADVAILSMNNFDNSPLSFYKNGTHMALLGDPSLRTHYIQSAKNISLEANQDRDAVTVSWEDSEEDDILGYYVYRSHKGHGGFVLVNDEPTTDLSLIDNNPYLGTNHYMVRAAKYTTTGSGSYENLSLGIRAEITNIQGVKAGLEDLEVASFSLYPNPAVNQVLVTRKSAETEPYIIFNQLGKEVAQGMLEGRENSIDINELASGVHFIQIGSQTEKFVKL